MKITIMLVCVSFLLSADESFWERQFSASDYTTEEKIISCLNHHSQQNLMISMDFLKEVNNQPLFYTALTSARTLLEVGCGSGEMIQLIGNVFQTQKIIGVDISQNAVDFASEANIHPQASFLQFDCLKRNISQELGTFDLCICSNTLEHFKQPFVLLDRILEACKTCILLVPYKQPVTDGYDFEGGAGHVYTFDENAFPGYEVLSCFIFQTSGWQHSSQGETPLQLAVLISKLSP